MKELSPLEVWDDVVLRISTTVAKDFPGTEVGDISQQLYLTILEHREKFKNPDVVGTTKALWTIAKQHALKLRADGLHISAQYAYCPRDIRTILEKTFTKDQWMDTEVPEDAVSVKGSADALDLQSDIKWAWEQLHIDEQRVIFEKYALKESLDTKGRKRLSRALEKLQEIVNTYPRPGHPRRAFSNSKAQHMIGSGYE